MPVQELSLYAALPERRLESFVEVLQFLTAKPLMQFKRYNLVYYNNDPSKTRRAADHIRLHAELPQAEASQGLSWVMQVVEGPEMGKRPVTSRIIHAIPCIQGSPQVLAADMGYVKGHAYFEQGYGIQIGMIHVSVMQIFTTTRDWSDTSTLEEISALQGSAIATGGTWIVQACASIKAGSVEETQRATNDLLKLKSTLQDYVHLEVNVDDLR